MAKTIMAAGVEHQLALTEPDRGNAIYGLTRWRRGPPVRHDAGAVLLRSAPHGQQGYPFCLEIDAEYRLDPVDGMHVAITVRNRGAYAAHRSRARWYRPTPHSRPACPMRGILTGRRM